MAVPHPKIGGGGELFGILWRIILLVKIRITKQLYYVDLIINYLKKMSVGIFDRAYMGIHI